MTCHHGPNDPNCTHGGRGRHATEPKTPDAEKYEIMEVAPILDHLVLKVKYPNCSSCSYEGLKVLVYLRVSPVQAMKWRKIDPHFADPKTRRTEREAPGPAARFPGSPEGWQDALAYAASKR